MLVNWAVNHCLCELCNGLKIIYIQNMHALWRDGLTQWITEYEISFNIFCYFRNVELPCVIVYHQHRQNNHGSAENSGPENDRPPESDIIHYCCYGCQVAIRNVTPNLHLTSCMRAAATICPTPLLPLWAPKRLAPPSRPRLQSADRNVAVGSHGQCVPTLTAAAAWRVNAAVSKAACWPWPLSLWPWKWCSSHVWRGLPLCQF